MQSAIHVIQARCSESGEFTVDEKPTLCRMYGIDNMCYETQRCRFKIEVKNDNSSHDMSSV